MRKQRKRSRRLSPAGGNSAMEDRLSHQGQPKPTGVAHARAQQEVSMECASQLRRIGDRYDLQQKILNVVSKLLCPGT